MIWFNIIINIKWHYFYNVFLAESIRNTSCAPICPERRPNFDSKTTKNVHLKKVRKISVKNITAYQLNGTILSSSHFFALSIFFRSLQKSELQIFRFWSSDLFEVFGTWLSQKIDFYYTVKMYSMLHCMMIHQLFYSELIFFSE